MAHNILQNALLQIVQTLNIKSPKIEIEDSPIQGYIANVNRISLTDSSSGKRLRLFAKRKPKEAKTEFAMLYKNEAIFYNDVMQAFRNMVCDTSLSLPLIPKCYLANEDIIILEDLVENGYKVWNPLNKCLNGEHVEAVLEAYGKFHAFSFALKHKHPAKFNAVGVKYDFYLTHYERLVNNGYYKSLAEKLVSCFDPETESHYIEAVESFLGNELKEYLQHLLDRAENDIFGHGDNWTHNFMFRYDANVEKPMDVCLLDFQIFRKMTPTVDISLFLSTCACTHEVFGAIDHFLKVYHQSLQKQLKDLNCPLEVYTWEIFKYEWENYSLKALMSSGILHKMMIADKDELECRQHIALPMQFVFISRNEALYQERMRVVIKYFYDNGIFTNVRAQLNIQN